MLVYINRDTISDFYHVARTSEHGDMRRYYLPRPHVGKRMIIVCRNGLSLNDLAGTVVDANIGTDVAMRGLAAEEDVGKSRTKLTIYRVARMGHEDTLASILYHAPKKENPDDEQ